jgi:hypothetical protein
MIYPRSLKSREFDKIVFWDTSFRDTSIMASIHAYDGNRVRPWTETHAATQASVYSMTDANRKNDRGKS